MKKYLLSFFALVLAIGMSAFTVESKNQLNPVYDWVDAFNSSNTFTGTRIEAMSYFKGCNLGAITCALAFEPISNVRVEEEDLKKQ